MLSRPMTEMMSLICLSISSFFIFFVLLFNNMEELSALVGGLYAIELINSSSLFEAKS
jgi:hypothetical protein